MAPLFRSDAEKATAGGFDPNDEEEGTIGGASPLPIGDGVAPLLFFATLYFGVTLHKKCLTHDKN